MDVKTAFLNVDLNEEVHIQQPDGFLTSDNEHLVCKLRKSIYRLKQTSRQWYLKFDEAVTSSDFEENKIDQCIYFKVSGSKFIFLFVIPQFFPDILNSSDTCQFIKFCIFTHMYFYHQIKVTIIMHICIIVKKSTFYMLKKLTKNVFFSLCILKNKFMII